MMLLMTAVGTEACRLGICLPLLVAASVALGCGSTAPAAVTPPPAGTASAAASGTLAPTPAAWSDDLPKDQKQAFMQVHVLPRMSKVFQASNPQHYGDFGCKTCHGPMWKEPKDYLPKLSMKDGKLTAYSERPAVAKFMAEKVVPEMAAALGKPPYNPATNTGFGCMGCHALENK
jgi:hypothetical protein